MLYYQKPHSQAKNTPSPKGCHHPYQIQKLEQSSENFVENAHICSKYDFSKNATIIHFRRSFDFWLYSKHLTWLKNEIIKILQIAIASCNKFWVCSRLPRVFRGRSVATSEENSRRRGSRGSIYAVKFLLEQFFRSSVTQNLYGQVVDFIRKVEDIISAVIVNDFALRYKSAQHFVMALIRSFLIRRIRMSEIDGYPFSFHLSEVGKFRTVISGYAFEHLVVFISEMLNETDLGFINRLCWVIFYLEPNGLPSLSFYLGHHLRFAFNFSADDAVNLPVSKLFSGIYRIGTLLNTVAEFSLVFAAFLKFCFSR